MSQGISITKAARALNRTPSTLRRWVQKGCPCVRPGEVGRGKGSLLNLNDVIAWRGGGQVQKEGDAERLGFIADVLMDSLRRDKIHERIGITSKQTAGLLALVYERYHKNLIKEPVERDKLPEQITQLLAIFVQ